MGGRTDIGMGRKGGGMRTTCLLKASAILLPVGQWEGRGPFACVTSAVGVGVISTYCCVKCSVSRKGDEEGKNFADVV